MSERAPPDQLELLLDGDPDDDGSFEAFIDLMNDPQHNPQIRGEAAPSTSRSHESPHPRARPKRAQPPPGTPSSS